MVGEYEDEKLMTKVAKFEVATILNRIEFIGPKGNRTSKMDHGIRRNSCNKISVAYPTS